MADDKSTWRRKSSGTSRYAKMLALGASLITGAPKSNPANPDATNAPQEKIQNIAQKPTDGMRAPALPDAPSTGADQIKQGMPQAMPHDEVDDVLQGVDNNDDGSGDVYDALRREQKDKQKNQNDNQNVTNKNDPNTSPKSPKSPKGSQLPTTQPAPGSGVKGAEQAVKSKAKNAVKKAVSKVVKEAVKQAAKAIWLFILANLEWIIPVVVGLIVALAFIAFVVYVYCLFPPSPCGKAGNLMSDVNKIGDSLRTSGVADRAGVMGDIQPSSGSHGVPLYKQNNYKNVSYGCGGTTIASGGCGIAATAMVLQFYGKKDATPPTLAKFSLKNGGRTCNAGTNHGFFPKVAKSYGMNNQNGISWDAAMSHLKKGHPVIVSGKGPPPFTSGGHYVVMTGFEPNNYIAVNDSAGGKSRDGKAYPKGYIKSHQHFLTVIYP